MDGVILDSKEAWRLAFKEAGDISDETFEKEFWGRDLMKNLEDINMADDEKKFCDKVFSKFLDQINMIDGAKQTLAQIDLPKALITNTTSSCIQLILDRFKLADHFKVIITSDQVEQGKPAADMILEACRELGFAPENCIVVGDSQEDVEAGREAGCRTVGVGIEADYGISRIDELIEIVRS